MSHLFADFIKLELNSVNERKERLRDEKMQLKTRERELESILSQLDSSSTPSKKKVSMKVAASPDSESDVEKVVFKDEKGKGTKRVKKEKKDPNQPKRNPSAYNLYYSENSVKLKAANPEMAQKDLMKMVGESWKTADESTKARLGKEAAALKEKFQIDMKAYESGKAGGSTSGSAVKADDEVLRAPASPASASEADEVVPEPASPASASEAEEEVEKPKKKKQKKEKEKESKAEKKARKERSSSSSSNSIDSDEKKGGYLPW